MQSEKRGIQLLSEVRKKGTDFDKGGEDSLDRLIQIGGIYQLKDIIDRLPFNKCTIKNWVYQEEGRFRECFHLVPVGAVRSMKLIDLTAFNRVLQETLDEGSDTRKGPKKRERKKEQVNHGHASVNESKTKA